MKYVSRSCQMVMETRSGGRIQGVEMELGPVYCRVRMGLPLKGASWVKLYK